MMVMAKKRKEGIYISWNIYIYIKEVGDKLNLQQSFRKRFALKSIRRHITETNNPSTIGPDELLKVRFPDLKENHSWNQEIDFQYFSIGYRCK